MADKIDLATTEEVGFVVATKDGIDFHRPDGKVTKLKMVDVMEAGDAQLQLLFAQFYMGTIQAQMADRQAAALEQLAAAMNAMAEAMTKRVEVAANFDPKAIVQEALGAARAMTGLGTEPGVGDGPRRVVVERPPGNGDAGGPQEG